MLSDELRRYFVVESTRVFGSDCFREFACWPQNYDDWIMVVLMVPLAVMCFGILMAAIGAARDDFAGPFAR